MSTNPLPLAGRVALITGAGTGIGRVLTQRYVAAGADVVIAARRRPPLDETAGVADAGPGQVHVTTADITNEDHCARLVTETLEVFGHLDVVCNNAATPGSDMAVSDMTLENWNATIATNVTGPMLVSREALRHAMIPARSGNIQFFSSAAAKQVLARKAHYAVSKLALLPLAQTMATEVGPMGIRVNTLVIGTVRGELLEGYVARIAGEEGVAPAVVEARLTASAALGRFVEPEEVADVSIWLASDAASAITGQDINVSAGAEKR